MRYPHLATMLFGVPLMAQPDTAHAFADAFIAILTSGAPIPAALEVVGDADQPKPEAYTSRHASAKFKDKPYAMTESGIAILPIYGAMVQRMGQIQPDCSEMTSYEKLGRRFDAMVADPEVKAIMLEIDSPGGQVAGNFEFANRIMAARDVKPVWAHANETAFSGGYSLGSAASRLFVANTGEVGSIGVLMLHMNQARRDEKQGYEYTAFYSGARKNDFNPHFPLSAAAKASAQDTVNRLHNGFAQHVAQARGITVESVNDTESGKLSAAEALQGNFVDGVASFSETLAALEDQVRSKSQFGLRPSAGRSAASTTQEVEMFTQETVNKQIAEALAARDAQHAASVDALKKEHVIAADLAVKAAVASEQEKVKAVSARRAAILALPEAKMRPSLAANVADSTDMTVDAAKAFLDKSPVEGKKSAFEIAMEGVKNPPVGVGSDADGEDRPVVVNASSIYESRRRDVTAARGIDVR